MKAAAAFAAALALLAGTAACGRTGTATQEAQDAGCEDWGFSCETPEEFDARLALQAAMDDAPRRLTPQPAPVTMDRARAVAVAAVLDACANTYSRQISRDRCAYDGAAAVANGTTAALSAFMGRIEAGAHWR